MPVWFNSHLLQRINIMTIHSWVVLYRLLAAGLSMAVAAAVGYAVLLLVPEVFQERLAMRAAFAGIGAGAAFALVFSVVLAATHCRRI
jgi:hypothetical protein